MNLKKTVDEDIIRRHLYVALPIACLLMLVLDGHRLFTCFMFVDPLLLAIRLFVPKKGSFADTLLPFAALFLAYHLNLAMFT